MFKPFDWNQFYSDVDELKRAQRKELCLCKDINVIALDIYECETHGKKVSPFKKVIVHEILDQLSNHTDLIIDDEIRSLAYLVNWAVKDLRLFPKEWFPLVEFLSDCDLGYDDFDDEIYF